MEDHRAQMLVEWSPRLPGGASGFAFMKRGWRPMNE
jgi:hypothetical protein